MSREIEWDEKEQGGDCSKYQDAFEVTWKHVGILFLGSIMWAVLLFGLGFIFG